MTIACGDSHTSTHGAFGAVAFGIGTSQVRDVLASQCLAMEPLKVRRIRVRGQLARGVYAKDVILEIIRRLGVNGGVGYAYEYAGDTIERMSMDERMTICNMSIEGGARVGYVNPDADDVRLPARAGGSRRRATRSSGRCRGGAAWRPIADAPYDDEVEIDAAAIGPTVTWGINPGQSVGVDEPLPSPATRSGPIARRSTRRSTSWACAPAQRDSRARRIDVAFIGSCTNGAAVGSARSGADRPRPPRRAARRALVVPGSQAGAARRPSAKGSTRLPRRRLRLARRRLLDVPGDESRQARRPRDLRLVVEPQLQGAAGQSDRPDAADEPGDGGRGRGRRRSRRTSREFASSGD